MKIKQLMSATALAGILASYPAIASAQTAAVDETAAPAPEDARDEAIVVTGSRIARPNETSTVPITTLSAAELTNNARVSVGDVLNDLPALRSTFGQQNSTRFLGTAGLNLLDLRGLGTQRTLVLVNGRRHVGADILNNAVSPDTNTFPTDLIERVDVVTGGDSAIYGSDALAGVVNFVLKDNYEGLQVKGQGAISQYGDAGSYFASVLAGKNFAGGRGNIAVNLEYSRQNQFFASQRDYLSQTDGFITVDTDSSGLAGGNTTLNSDGTIDARFFRDIRVGTFSAGGLVALAGAARGANGALLCPTNYRDPRGIPFTCNLLFQRDGTLVPQTGQRVGVPGGSTTVPTTNPSGGSFIGGNGDTRREGELLQLLPALDRYSANLIGHYDFSDALVAFVEAKYTRTESFGTGGSGPAFFTGGTIDGFYERPRLDNPYLSPQARDLLASAIIASGTNPTTGAALTPANITAINNGSFRFILRKNLTDLGVRSEQAKRETYRIVGGLRGDFNDDWKYEVSVNYGEFQERTRVLGNVNVQRQLLALDAVDQGLFQNGVANGNIVCGSQLDPTRAYDDFAGNAALLASDIAACRPLNPFGEGNVSQAARNYILQDTVSRGKITQLDISGFVSGDTSGFLNLPGGPVGFAVGGEFRRETAFFQADPLVENGYTFYNALSRFAPPSFEVTEGFAEVRVPFLKDLPFAHELTATGAARVSSYKGSAGTVVTYNGGVDYAPIPDIRFRVNYARAIRAPNLADLYSPVGQNFAPGFGDPCSAINIAAGTQFRPANCAAAGIPNTYDFRYAQSLEIQSGGNVNLEVETSTSYTYGIVLQPRFIPGLTVSIDYYNIGVSNVITAPSAQGIVNGCYDQQDANNAFCTLFQRDDAAGTVTGTPFRIIEGSLQQTLLNYAQLKVRGVDVDIAYQRRIGNVNINTHLVYTHALEGSQFLTPGSNFANSFNGELGNPIDALNWNINADFGPIYAYYQFRYLGKMSNGAIENHTTFQGREPQNLDDFDVPFLPEIIYMDFRLGFNFDKKSNFYVGVDNLTNRIPPYGLTGTGGGSGIYDAIGRRVYAGIVAKF